MKIKNKERIYRVFMLLFVMALISFVTITLLSYNGSLNLLTLNSKNANNTTRKLDAMLATVAELIEEKYIGEIDEEKLIDGALAGMVSSVGDKYTEYYTKEQLEEFRTETIGNFVGIGIYMQADRETGIISVIEVMKNSPAEAAGVQIDDIILKADGVEYTAEQINELAFNVKGQEGTKVTLTIKRGEEVFDVEVTRGTVHVNYVEGEILKENNIGYIYLSKFDEQSSIDFKNKYEELIANGATSLIIDLRENGGGIVDEALDIADYICEKDDVLIITIDKEDKEEIKKSENDPIINIPVVVIVNENSASASEILVGALKDNKKAEIVGEKTFGKGVIQDLIPLTNGGALRVTSAEYYTPNREKINEIGIEPDYEVKLDEKNPDVDEQLNKAIEILKEKTAN